MPWFFEMHNLYCIHCFVKLYKLWQFELDSYLKVFLLLHAISLLNDNEVDFLNEEVDVCLKTFVKWNRICSDGQGLW